jgi:hypothetical protein
MGHMLPGIATREHVLLQLDGHEVRLSNGLHERAGSLDALFELAARDEAEGLGDAPWPPHFAKQRGEPKRVQPSRAKKS